MCFEYLITKTSTFVQNAVVRLYVETFKKCGQTLLQEIRRCCGVSVGDSDSHSAVWAPLFSSCRPADNARSTIHAIHILFAPENVAERKNAFPSN
jgi:hypothetical protein